MFAKLKKKIQEEGGSVPNSPLADADKSPAVHGPGLASPIKTDLPGCSPLRDTSMGDFEEMSVSSEISEVKSTTNKEDLFKKIVKKNEQIRKLEGKITDMAAMIKERNRNIDRLEKALEKQREESEQKLQNLDAKLTKSNDSTVTILQRKDRELEIKIQKLEKALKKENTRLLEQLQDTDSVKIRHLSQVKQGEQKAELAAIELANIKEILSITQQDLEASQSEVREKRKNVTSATKKEQDLDKEIQSLMSQIGEITTLNETLDETCTEGSKNLKQFQDQMKHLEQEIQHKTSQVKSTSQSLAELQHRYDVLERNSQQYQQKMEQMVKEKDENRSQLKERVHTLEQRLEHGQLSGDERVTALQNERSALEMKLSESREQLTNVKLTWSDKISQLERQISNLNQKIVDDSQQINAHDKGVEQLKQHHRTQIASLEASIAEHQQEIKQLEEMITKKENYITKQKEEHTRALEAEKQALFDKETELTATLSDLRSQLETVQRTKERETTVYEQKLMQLQSGQDEWLEKEIDAEKRITSLEEKLNSRTSQLNNKSDDCDRLRKSVNQSDVTIKELNSKIKELESTEADRVKRTDNLETDFSKLEKDFTSCTNEKDDLLLRNAQLSQEYESYKRRVNESREDLTEELQQKNNSIAGLEQVLQEMTHELTTSKSKIEELERQQMVALNDIESAEINRLQAEINNLEDQLSDRNKTIKKQQQRLADLKKTLQRELNVQALPNDEVADLGRDSPKLSHGHGATSGRDTNSAHAVNGYSAYKSYAASSGDERPSLQVSSSSTIHVHKHMLYSGATNYSTASHISDDTTNSPMKSSQSKSTGALKYQRDINFDYLRHVVLKFMLSRESEAVHLIKAIAVLLDFTKDEQKLLKETLEYKMSWFGTPPQLGHGQLSKYVPPTF